MLGVTLFFIGLITFALIATLPTILADRRAQKK